MAPLLTHRLVLPTGRGITCHDITTELQALVEEAGLREGLLVAAGQHTTTALVVNEAEERLLADIATFFAQLVPADRPYRHNDLHLRPGIPADEPRNAHSHLIALMLGNPSACLCMQAALAWGAIRRCCWWSSTAPAAARCWCSCTAEVRKLPAHRQ